MPRGVQPFLPGPAREAASPTVSSAKNLPSVPAFSDAYRVSADKELRKSAEKERQKSAGEERRKSTDKESQIAADKERQKSADREQSSSSKKPAKTAKETGDINKTFFLFFSG